MKHLIILSGLLLMITTTSHPVFADSEPSIQSTKKPLLISELLKNHHYWDQRFIQLTGEVIGQPIFADGRVCIHLLDQEGNAIGVWMDKIFLTEIHSFGKYRIRGDIVSVVGFFYEICSFHSGDTDLHIDQLTVIQPGKAIPADEPNWSLLLIGFLLMVYPALLFVQTQNEKRKQRSLRFRGIKS